MHCFYSFVIKTNDAAKILKIKVPNNVKIDSFSGLLSENWVRGVGGQRATGGKGDALFSLKGMTRG